MGVGCFHGVVLFIRLELFLAGLNLAYSFRSEQLTLALSVVALALVVSCALIATAQLQSEETVLYGLGSGEEQVSKLYTI